MSTSPCRHPRRHITTVTRCYTGPVSVRPNPAAHGNVCHWETCRCGATRATNVNGRHVERGRWTATWRDGDRVQGGDIPEDRDTGRVSEVHPDGQVTVAWDSGVSTTQPGSLLRPEVVS